MNKSAYIKKPEVKQFIEFCADKIFGTFNHSYLIRQTGKEWNCTNIRDAALNYRWPWRGIGNSLCDNASELDRLQINLRNALKSNNSAYLVNSSLDVFKWGGVLNGNQNPVIVNKHSLVDFYSATIDQLNLAGDDTTLGDVWNMNAGFTKIYSFLTNGIIIYDSRVGAALGFLVKQCATQNNWKTIPQELLFPYAPPRNSATALNPLNRNPGSYLGVSFPSFSNRPCLQAVFMLRASWIIAAVIEKVKWIEESDLQCDKIKIPKHRFIEAGLFMIGYDLPAENTAKKQSPKKNLLNSKATTYQYQTLCKDCKFHAELSDDSSTLRISRQKGRPAKVKINEIISALHWLTEIWGTIEFFPLDNDAVKVRKGRGKNGFGTAMFKAIGKKFNSPDASSLVSLLFKIEVLEWDQNRRPSNFRINIMPSREQLIVLLKNEFDGKYDEA
jgi:hypothetical protein